MGEKEEEGSLVLVTFPKFQNMRVCHDGAHNNVIEPPVTRLQQASTLLKKHNINGSYFQLVRLSRGAKLHGLTIRCD